MKLTLTFLLLILLSAGAQAAERAMEVRIGGRTFTAILADNGTAKAFSGRLPLTLDMSELNGNEKYHYLDRSLPSAPERVGQIRAGDIMLYGDNCVVLFYRSFSTSYRYTRIGHIEDASTLESAAGRGDAAVSFSQR
ncbi:MAG: hypothetical protein IJ702_06725 [Fretibacterium sp.]|nr:hypothetical protein [Fretibacterium sp.]